MEDNLTFTTWILGEDKIWKEAQEDGRKKAKWDGNGKEREWKKRREEELRDN